MPSVTASRTFRAWKGLIARRAHEVDEVGRMAVEVRRVEGERPRRRRDVPASTFHAFSGLQVRVADVLRVHVVELRERRNAEARPERGAKREAAAATSWTTAGVGREARAVALVRVGAQARRAGRRVAERPRSTARANSAKTAPRLRPWLPRLVDAIVSRPASTPNAREPPKSACRAAMRRRRVTRVVEVLVERRVVRSRTKSSWCARTNAEGVSVQPPRVSVDERAAVRVRVDSCWFG